MKISVFVPAHNESGNLKKLVSGIHRAVKNISKDFEIIIVNDNSSDNSEDILRKLKKKYPELRFVSRHDNPGPGNAYREGFKMVKGDIVVTLDGDLSHDPFEIPKFIKALDKADVVCGSRYTKGGRAHMDKSRTVISGIFNLLFRNFVGFKVRDFTSGFRALRRGVIDEIKLKSKSFGIYIEIPIKAHLKGFRITEVPITYHKRYKGESNLNYFRQGPEYLKVIFKNFGGIILRRMRK
ncbi:glycosyltransferase [Candidatus Woesearchaeota archaeon]|nr:glycosyltransferase [Candidatus Woesearchaeota archaeon]